MKSNLNFRKTSFFAIFIYSLLLLTGCSSGQKPGNQDSPAKKTVLLQNAKDVTTSARKDSADLTNLVRRLYKWHETAKMKYDGFKALKTNETDTLYTRIDLNENQKSVDELKQTGLFSSDFLTNYRKIAERMDKELRDGSSLWPEGELSTFGNDSDAWCNCQDFPVDKYWNIIKLVDLKIKDNNAEFKWTWGDDFYYKVKAIKEGENWRISYLQGFDMNAYSWEWWKKNKK